MIDVIAGNDGGLVIVVAPNSRDGFNQLVQRATNLWPDATPEIKHFADQVTNRALLAESKGGKLQNYEAQNTSPKPQVIRANLICALCQSDNLVDIEQGKTPIIWKCSHCMAANQSRKDYERT